MCTWCVSVQCNNGIRGQFWGAVLISSSTFALSTVLLFLTERHTPGFWVILLPRPPISLLRCVHHKCMLTHLTFHVARSGIKFRMSGSRWAVLPGTTSFTCSLVCQWTLRLIPFPGYCDQCCNDYPSTHLLHFFLPILMNGTVKSYNNPLSHF